MRSSIGKIAAGVDLKAALSLVTCPPTPNYRWHAPLVPIAELPSAPDWLIDIVRRSEPVAQPLATASLKRWQGDVCPYARAALERELAGAALAKPGERNAALFRAAARLGSLCAAGHLPFDPVARGLLLAAEECGLTRDDGPARVHATIESGLKAGAKSPRGIPTGGRRHG